MKFGEHRRIGDSIQERINAQVNQELRRLLDVEVDDKLDNPEKIDTTVLYGQEPDHVEIFNVGARRFGAELYRSESVLDKHVLAIAQHGYGGRARDFSKLAEVLNQKGISVLSVDMHIDGDDITRMSMNIQEWAEVALASLSLPLLQMRGNERKIFIGQGSGGTVGAHVMERGRDHHPYNGALLIGPALLTMNHELVGAIDEVVQRYVHSGRDVMIDWRLLTSVTRQCADESLNTAYQAALAMTPGLPWLAARSAFDLPRHEIVNKFGNIDRPTIMLRGDLDTEDIASLDEASEVVENTWNEHVEIADPVSEAAHQVQIDQPQKIAELVEGLLKNS